MSHARLAAIVLAVGVIAAGIGPAFAQEGVSGSNDVVPIPPTVAESEVTPADPGSTVDVSQASDDPDGTLPFTGSDALTLVGIALGVLGLGVVLMVAARRRAAHALTTEV
jgi:hypothetical protein